MASALLGLSFVTLLCGAVHASYRYENVAVNKQATQSSTLDYPDRSPWHYYWQARTAVDGRKDCNSVDDDHYSGTDYSHRPYWQVDLGRTYNISNITVYGPQPDDHGQFKEFRVQVSSRNDFYTASVIYTSSRTEEGKVHIPIQHPPITAQYVRIDRTSTTGESTALLILCEVEVYTAVCADGFFGQHCNNRCGRCAGGATCDVSTGHCPHGCEGLHQPPLCRACPHIDHCVNHQCTNTSNVLCMECEDQPAFYKPTNTDTQCERKCAWNNHYCWPGTCADDLTKNCSCEPGFRLISRRDLETSCQLEPTNTPTIHTCDTTFEDVQGHQKAALRMSVSRACQYLTDVYGNFQPVLLWFDLFAEFSVDTRCIYRPYFIHDSLFGITDTTAYIIKQPVTGSRSVLHTEHLQVDNSSSLGAIRIAAQTQNLSLTYHLMDGQRLCVKYESLGGGYLSTVDPRHWPHTVSNPVPYQKTNTTKEICYRYDSTPPKHCLEDNTCTMEPLHIKDRITRSDIVHLEFLGWKDPIPAGGNSSHASGIESYKISVSEILPSGGNLTVENGSVYSVMLNRNETSTTLHLATDEPKLYCITIDVKDIAGNVHHARRFVLYDNTSSLTSATDKPFNVTSASPLTQYTWQTHYNDICISWKDHFYNDFYVNNSLLNPIEADQYVSISGVYEQTTPPLPVSGTPNVNGIVNFFFSSKLNNGQFSTPTPVPRFQNQSLCQHFNVRDGQTYTLNIEAVDIVSNSYSEQRIVHIDGSLPNVINFWLVKDGHKVLTVNSIQQLTELDISFEALDFHSGVRNINWMFGDTSGTGTTQKGTIPVMTTKAGCASQVNPCYCPSVGLCEVYDYNVSLQNLVNLNAHDRNYFFMVNVTNNAMLTNSARMDIVVDDNKPAVIGR